jgi:hypothetical protein
MGLKHIQDKRTGRPRGSRNSPAWVRDVRWAYKHLGKPDAVPPTALAGLLVALGREHPDRLVSCLATADGAAERKGGQSAGQAEIAKPEPQDQVRGPRAEGESLRGRIKKLRVTEFQLAAYLTGRRQPTIKNLPPDVQIVDCEREPEGNVIVLTLRSEAFPQVPEDQKVPEFEPEFAS